jgi:uncharacterized protein with PQ loop repeat
MTWGAVTVTLGWLAVGLGTGVAYAQFNRVRRRGVEGVSLATWTLFVLLAVFWATYGGVVHSWEVVLGSLLALPWQMLILWRLAPWSKWPVVLRSFAAVMACCTLPALFAGWSGAVVGAGVAGIVTRTPQLVLLVRGGTVDGVSVGSWTLAVLVSALWVAYYAGAHLWAVLTVTAIAGSLSFVIAGLSTWRRRHASYALGG